MTATEHNMYSSYREMLLEHLIAEAIMRHLWLGGFSRLEMLTANSIVLHIQLKASHRGSATSKVNVNDALARKPSGCVIWMSFDPTTLEFDHFFWFGGPPGQKLPDLDRFSKATHTKRNALGEKTERPNIRIVPRAEFERLGTVEELVTRLFGVVAS